MDRVAMPALPVENAATTQIDDRCAESLASCRQNEAAQYERIIHCLPLE